MSEFNKYSTDGGATFIDVEDSNAVHWADNGVLGAKNLIPYPFKNTTKTLNGVTYTDNGDGTITVNTPTSSTTEGQFDIATDAFKSTGLKRDTNTDYILTGFPTGTSYTSAQVSLRLILMDSNNQNRINVYLSSADATTGLRFTMPSTHHINNLVLYVNNNVTINNLTFKPMIRLASDTDNTYAPYAMTNRELTDIAPYRALDCNNAKSNIILVDANTLNTPAKQGIASSNNGCVLTAFPNMHTWNVQFAFIYDGNIYTRSVAGTADAWTNWSKVN